MKFVLKYIYSILESVGKARAATHFARTGNYEAARRIMAE